MKHTFVICAYKESPYLEECIRSLKAQSVPSELILATSTKGPFLEELCRKYEISYQVRNGQSGIAPDWNYAFSLAKTKYVTIAHQDDRYEKDYAKEMIEWMERVDNPLISFSDYAEIRDGQICEKGRNLAIKRLLLTPLKQLSGAGKKGRKRFALRFGNAICCPSVTYNKEKIEEYLKEEGREELFLEHFRSNLDWQTWEWLSRKEGAFVYVPKRLMCHRIHEDSETTATIKDHQRKCEDYEMFCKFWPKSIAKCITGWYGKSEDDNQV